MTGYRTGFVAGDAEVIEQFRRYRSNPGIVPSQFVNEAAAIAWSDDEHVTERRRVFSAKKELFLSFFDSVHWSVIGREASLYLWVRVPNEDSAEEWALRLLKQGVVVSPGSMFAVTEAGNGYLRIAMVPSIEECKEAINIWKTLV